METKVKVNAKFIISLSLIVLVGFMLTVTTFSYSKFYQKIDISEFAQVAKPTFNFNALTQGDNVQVIALENINPNMGVEIYHFNIKNFVGTQISETLNKYTITIDYLGNLPLLISVKHNDIEIASISQIDLSDTSDDFVLSAGVSMTDSFTLEVAWDTDEKSYIYSNMVDILTIHINWSQVD